MAVSCSRDSPVPVATRASTIIGTIRPCHSPRRSESVPSKSKIAQRNGPRMSFELTISSDEDESTKDTNAAGRFGRGLARIYVDSYHHNRTERSVGGHSA